jgi:hypothetical protein
MEKKLFIESLRSDFKAKGYTDEQLTGAEQLAGVLFDSMQKENETLRTALELKAAEIVGEKLGDLGNGKTVAETIVALQGTIDGMRSNNAKPKGFWDAFRAEMEANKDKIMSTQNSGSVKLTVRTAEPIVLANIVAPKSLGYRDSVVDAAPVLPEFLPSSLINEMNGGVGSNPYVWMERTKKEGVPTYVVEGNAKPFIDYNWTENEVTAKLIAAIVPISKIATWNYPTLEQEVRKELMDELINKYNDALINGAGTTEINGLKSIYAVEFVTAGIQLPEATLWDVLLKAWLQSRKAVRGQRPTAILMSIDKVNELDLQKDKNGNYILPTWLTNANKSLKNIPIIETEYLTENEVLIGDFTKATFNFVKNIEFEIGWINDDFQKNRYAIRGEFYGMQFVKAHKNNFVKISDIETAKDAITIPVA